MVRGQCGIAQHSTQTPRLEEEKTRANRDGGTRGAQWSCGASVTGCNKHSSPLFGTSSLYLVGDKEEWGEGMGRGAQHEKCCNHTQRGRPIQNPTTQLSHRTRYTAHPNTAPMTRNPIPSRTEAAAASPPPYTLHHSPYTHRNSQTPTTYNQHLHNTPT